MIRYITIPIVKYPKFLKIGVYLASGDGGCGTGVGGVGGAGGPGGPGGPGGSGDFSTSGGEGCVRVVTSNIPIFTAMIVHIIKNINGYIIQYHNS